VHVLQFSPSFLKFAWEDGKQWTCRQIYSINRLFCERSKLWSLQRPCLFPFLCLRKSSQIVQQVSWANVIRIPKTSRGFKTVQDSKQPSLCGRFIFVLSRSYNSRRDSNFENNNIFLIVSGNEICKLFKFTQRETKGISLENINKSPNISPLCHLDFRV